MDVSLGSDYPSLREAAIVCFVPPPPVIRAAAIPSRGARPAVSQKCPNTLQDSGLPNLNRARTFFPMGQGSTGNVIAAVCSFFIPGLGQLVQGRFLIALLMFVLAAVLWVFWLGWLIHLWSILDAALFRPKL
jgi:hypothetical protein